MYELQGMPGLSLQSLSSYIFLIMISSLRIGAFLLASPFFGSRMVPLPIRIVFSFCMGLWVLSYIEFPSLGSMLGVQLLPIIFQELVIGLSCGMVLSICFSAVIIAGEKIAATSGLAFALQVDPSSGTQSPVISQILSLFLLILLFSTNGHLLVFEAIYKSYDVLPIGTFAGHSRLLERVISSSDTMFKMAIVVALPIISILVFINIGIGFITKSAPQLNLFSFGFPLTILGTFFALYFSVDALQFVFRDLLDQSLTIVKLILGSSVDG